MSARIIALPKNVKLLNGNVKSPVTQVADVAVKNKSINAIGLRRAMGKASKSVPPIIRMKKEKRMVFKR